MGCYGYERNTTPNIDAFAEDGVLFDRCVNTGGGTLSVHMSMLTSLFPENHQMISGDKDYARRLEEQRITLPEVLNEKGYVTAGFTDHGWVQGKFGFDQGFDTFDDKGGHFEEILPKVYRWIERNRAERFFLFVHTYDVHSKWGGLPYSSPGDFNSLYFPDYSGDFDGCADNVWEDGRSCGSRLLLDFNRRLQRDLDISEYLDEVDLEHMVALYDGGVAYVDRELGAFFELLKAQDLYRESLIIITADHGEEFMEHGLFLHRQNFEEVARVPLVVKFPSSLYRKKRFSDLVASVDIMPFILDFLEIEPVEGMQGQSLMPILSGNELPREAVHIWGRGWWSRPKIINHEWSLVVDKDTGAPFRLYDIGDDLFERHDVLDQHPEVARILSEQLQRLETRDRQLYDLFKKRSGESNSTFEMDDDTVEKLQALGYLDEG